jgi:hypothetical protein
MSKFEIPAWDYSGFFEMPARLFYSNFRANPSMQRDSGYPSFLAIFSACKWV